MLTAVRRWRRDTGASSPMVVAMMSHALMPLMLNIGVHVAGKSGNIVRVHWGGRATFTCMLMRFHHGTGLAQVTGQREQQ